MTTALKLREKTKLHPYQAEAVAQIKALIRSGEKDICLSLPTGCGKTVTSIALIGDYVNHFKKKVLVAVPYTPLVSQFRDEILEHLQGSAPRLGLYASEFSSRKSYSYPDSKDIIIAMCQTIESRHIISKSEGEFLTLQSSPLGSCAPGLIILDEAHLSGFRLSYRVLKQLYPNAAFLYLTASPWRSTGGQLPPGTKYVQSISIASAIENQYLTDYQIFPLSPYTVGETGEEEEDFSRLSDRIGQWEPFLSWEREKKKALFVFGSKKALNHYIAPFIEKGYDPRIVTDETPRKEREQIFEDFENNPDNKLIFSINVLCAGCNLPAIQDIHLIRSSTNLALLTQIIGRSIRKKSGKTISSIYDYFGNWLNLPTPKQLPGWQEIIKKQDCGTRCKNCNSITDANAEYCHHCGYSVNLSVNSLPKLEELGTMARSAIAVGAFPTTPSTRTNLIRLISPCPLKEIGENYSYPEILSAYFQRCFLNNENPKKAYVLARKLWGKEKSVAGVQIPTGAIFGGACTTGLMNIHYGYLNSKAISVTEVRKFMELEFGEEETEFYWKLNNL